jgi:hypothetical protein
VTYLRSLKSPGWVQALVSSNMNFSKFSEPWSVFCFEDALSAAYFKYCRMEGLLWMMSWEDSFRGSIWTFSWRIQMGELIFEK